MHPRFLEAIRRDLYRERPEDGIKLLRTRYKDSINDNVEHMFGD